MAANRLLHNNDIDWMPIMSVLYYIFSQYLFPGSVPIVIPRIIEPHWNSG